MSERQASQTLDDQALALPASIVEALGDRRRYRLDTVGMTGSVVRLYDDCVLKVQPLHAESRNERRMLDWLAGRLPVPRLLAAAECDGLSYLLQRRVPGQMLCDPAILAQPDVLIDRLAEAIEMLHAVDVTDCPTRMDLDRKFELAAQRVAQGLVDVGEAEPETFGPGGFASPAALLDWLREMRPTEELVFAHGDCCLPNILTDGAEISGFIDLGRAGIADRYADIALAVRSLRYNYTGADIARWEAALFERLGLEPNDEKIRYYILLDELF